MFKVAFLLAGVLAIAGCVTEPPPATPTVTTPPTMAVREPTRAPTWTAWPKPPMAGLGERNLRIEIALLPLRGAHEELEAAIARANVPREAVAIDVGCRTGALRRLDNMGRDPSKEFLRSIDYSVEAASAAPYGHTVFLKLKLRNTSYKPIRFFTGGRPPHDFIITTGDGEEIWNWQCARVRELPLDGRTLLPGEKLQFVGEWEQVDSRGEPVPAGGYLVRGILKMESPERPVTPPHELRVRD